MSLSTSLQVFYKFVWTLEFENFAFSSIPPFYLYVSWSEKDFL